MRDIVFNLFLGGKKKAVTFSYDDGERRDIRLTEMLEKIGAKCTYNLNAHFINAWKDRIDKDFVRYLSDNHEIALHSYDHPSLDRIPSGYIMNELYEDKRELEDIIGKPIVGAAYPNGSYNQEVVNALAALGIKYCRTVVSTRSTGHPASFLEWHPTCHHNQALELVDGFLNNGYPRLPIFYIWGHSHELREESDWQKMDYLTKKLGEREDIWYATNGEIYDYLTALKGLRINIAGNCAVNPSATTVYATVEGKSVAFAPGLTRF